MEYLKLYNENFNNKDKEFILFLPSGELIETYQLNIDKLFYDNETFNFEIYKLEWDDNLKMYKTYDNLKDSLLLRFKNYEKESR